MFSSFVATVKLSNEHPEVLFKFFTFVTGRLIERGAYFEILKNRNSDLSYAF